jgi:hypothetical protein
MTPPLWHIDAVIGVGTSIPLLTMQHRVLADDEVRRDLRRWVPEYQTTMPPALQRVQSVRNGLKVLNR